MKIPLNFILTFDDMLEILRITYPRNLSGHITPLKFVISFNNIQININIFWGILFVCFIYQIQIFDFIHKYTSITSLFYPARAQKAPYSYQTVDFH